MKQQLEMLIDAPPSVSSDRAVQHLIKLLVEAVLKLPDSEKKSVLHQAIAPLFEALLALNKVKQISGVGLIWMELICSGYQDYAGRLWPPRTALSEEAAPGAPGASELGETPDVT
jgi:hypothetical protein